MLSGCFHSLNLTCGNQTAIIPSTEDVSISFLPLAHMFERVVQVRLRLDDCKSSSLSQAEAGIVFSRIRCMSCRRWYTVLVPGWDSSRVTFGCCQMTWRPCSRPFSPSCLDSSTVSMTKWACVLVCVRVLSVSSKHQANSVIPPYVTWGKNSPGSKWSQNSFQEMAAELCCGQEVRWSKGGHHQAEQHVGQTHLPQSAGITGLWSSTLVSHAEKWCLKALPSSSPGVSGGTCAGHGDGSSTHFSICSQLPPSCSGLPGTECLSPTTV